MAAITNVILKIQNGTTRTLFTSFKWTTANTKEYSYQWEYSTSNGTWFEGSTTTSAYTNATYSGPENATKVRVRVKPIAKNDSKDKPYWTASWSSWVTWTYEEYIPPDVKTVQNMYILPYATNGTDVVCYWSWKRSYTDSYSVEWQYGTGQSIWFEGSSTTTKLKNSTFTLNTSIQNKVRVRVKPIATTKKVNGVDVEAWTADWSSWMTFYAKDMIIPEIPPVPTSEVDKYTLKVSCAVTDIDTNCVVFHLANNVTYKTIQYVRSDKKLGECKAEFIVNGLRDVKVRAKSVNTTGTDEIHSEWSDWSESIELLPNTVTGLAAKGSSKTSVTVSWNASSGATGYTIEYTDEQRNFDLNDLPQSVTVEKVTNREITGLESGKTWYFRVKATNSVGDTEWSKIVNSAIGEVHNPPTTWTRTSTFLTTQNKELFWVANSLDNSALTMSQVRWRLSTSSSWTTVTLAPTATTPDVEDALGIHSYEITNSFTSGTIIAWQVRTRNVTSEYSEWSSENTFTVYTQPTISVSIQNGGDIDHYPIDVAVVASPSQNKPLSYTITIRADANYDTVDSAGRTKRIKNGDTIMDYTWRDSLTNAMTLYITPDMVTLMKDMPYTMFVSTTLDSGLDATSENNIACNFEDVAYFCTAQLGYDKSTYSMMISPQALSMTEELVEGVTLSVYRRNYDDTMTLIMDNIANDNTFVVDPYPTLNRCSYRIVSTQTSTGAMTFYDTPYYPINDNVIVIQWDAKYESYADNPDVQEQYEYTASRLVLPYNINASETSAPSKDTVQYAGRRHVVNYYGNSIELTGSFSSEIAITDTERLMQIQQLMNYMGDVYLRAPNGVGYNCSIDINYSTSYDSLVIPVTINSTKTEGGL